MNAMNQPLHGRRILELTHVWSGPLCGQVLADLGAEVIRIESRARLDIHRRGGPYPDGRAGINRSGTWNAQNRGKLGCTLDLKTPEGKALLLALVGKSDAVIENFTPGTLDRLGFGFAQLRAANPRIVLLSLSGFGHTGPYRDSLAYGPMMDAATGLSAATSYDDGVPRAVNGWAADVGGALYGCAAILRSLLDEHHAARHLDVSQFEAGVMFVAEALLEKANGGTASISAMTRDLAVAVPTLMAEQWLAVAPRTLEEIQALCDLTGGAAATLRVIRHVHAQSLDEARAELSRIVKTWAATRRLDDALAAMTRAGVPAAPIATVEDLLADDRLQARDAWIDVEHPETGRTRTYGPAIRLQGAAVNARPAPLLGGDNEYVFGNILGLSGERVRELTERNVL
jgi:crotonobetainyl-CoA:carnitine CoA-transferase CaiB-like acyl-CoA transferase